MNSLTPPTVLEWIRKIRADLTPGGTITRLELWHTADGEAGEPLFTFLMEDRPESEDPDDLAAEIWNEAETDAATRPQGSYQRYVIRAFRGDDRLPEMQRAFVCTGAAISSLTDGHSEPATPRGIIAQDQRHTENLHAMMVHMSKAVAGNLASQNKALNDQVLTLQTQRSAYFDAEQRFKDREHERQMEREDREASRQRLDKIIENGMMLLGPLLPLILAKLTSPSPEPQVQQPLPAAGSGFQPPGGVDSPSAAGGEAPSAPPPTTPGAAAHAASVARAVARDLSVHKLLETLQPEQMQTIISALTPEQAIGLSELYGAHRDEHERNHQESP